MTVLKNARVFHDAYRFDTDMDQLQLNYGAEELPDTQFNDNTRLTDAGLKTIGLAYNGIWAGGSGSLDEVLQGDVGQTDVPITVSPNAGADGDPCYFSRYLWAMFNPFDGGTVGDQHRFAGDAGSRNDPLVRGQYLHNASVTSSGQGTAVQVGAVGASEQLYAVLHVTATSGTSQTLDVKIQSDDASGFSSPTDQITFSQVTTSVTSQWATPISGSITDDWWRVDHTLGGTNPDFTYVVAIGIV